jgi:hypothetical protein
MRTEKEITELAERLLKMLKEAHNSRQHEMFRVIDTQLAILDWVLNKSDVY